MVYAYAPQEHRNYINASWHYSIYFQNYRSFGMYRYKFELLNWLIPIKSFPLHFLIQTIRILYSAFCLSHIPDNWAHNLSVFLLIDLICNFNRYIIFNNNIKSQDLFEKNIPFFDYCVHIQTIRQTLSIGFSPKYTTKSKIL